MTANKKDMPDGISETTMAKTAPAQHGVSFERNGVEYFSFGAPGAPLDAILAYLPPEAENVRELTPEEIANHVSEGEL